MRDSRVISIDPAPGKPSTVFDGATYENLSATVLRTVSSKFPPKGAQPWCAGTRH